jgi:hypothetical protein
MLNRLETTIGITSVAFAWQASCPSDRKQYVKIGPHSSAAVEFSSGVPEVSAWPVTVRGIRVTCCRYIIWLWIACGRRPHILLPAVFLNVQSWDLWSSEAPVRC